MSSPQNKNSVTHKIAGLGSSLHGGRPTFALCKHGDSFTLYELLPKEQASAHKQRWESNRRVSKSVKVVETTFLTDDEWDWDDWHAIKIASIEDSRFEIMRGLLKDVMGGTDGEYTDLLLPEDQTLLVPEAIGVKLSLAFLGIKPLRRVDKQRACVRQIRKMSTEECYYWHSLCRSPSTPNGGKALRTLFTGHMK